MNFQDIKKALYEKITEYKKENPLAKDSDFKFKRCQEYLLLLFVPETMKTNESRKIVVDKQFAKFRAEMAYCIAILDTENEKLVQEHTNQFGDSILVYKVNHWIFPDRFDTNLEQVCTNGLHYFNSLLAAYCYDLLHYVDEPDLYFTFAEDGSMMHVFSHGVCKFHF